MTYPKAGLLQGAEAYLRDVAQGRGVNPEVAGELRDVLSEWDAKAVAAAGGDICSRTVSV